MGGGTYIRAGSSKNTSIIFSLTEGVGALAEALKVFKVSYYYYEFITYVVSLIVQPRLYEFFCIKLVLISTLTVV